MELLLFILIAYGMSNIIVFGSIFDSFRTYWQDKSPNFFGKLFSCMMCLPTWVGFFLSLVYFSPTLHYGMEDINFFNLFTIHKELSSVFFDGMLASGSVWLIHTLQEHFE